MLHFQSHQSSQQIRLPTNSRGIYLFWCGSNNVIREYKIPKNSEINLHMTIKEKAWYGCVWNGVDHRKMDKISYNCENLKDTK